MSQPSQNYIDKITRWAQGGVELSRMNLRPDQRFRALLVMNAYRLMIENPTAQPRMVVKNLAARDYALIAANAEMGIAEDVELMQVLGIRRDPQTGAVSARRDTEIANDIYCVNALVGRLNVSQNHLDKLLYQANTRWLSKFGQQTGNVSAIREAQRNLEKMNNDWKEDANPADALKPGAERNITGDISIIKPDRTNYTDDELRDLTPSDLKKDISDRLERLYEIKEKEEGEGRMRELERMVLLRVVDNLWMDHIDAMDQLKSGIGLRAIGQQDPAAEYAKEGFDMFEQLIGNIQEDTVRYCYGITSQTGSRRRVVVSGGVASKSEFKDEGAGQTVTRTAGRNSHEISTAADAASATETTVFFRVAANCFL